MGITCRCSSCGATYQVDQQYAGRKIKCPKCSAAIVVEAAGPKPPAATPPRKPPAPFKTGARIEPEDAPAQPPPEQDAAPDPLGPGAVVLPGLEGIVSQRSPLGAPLRRRHAKKKADNSRLWIAAGLGAGALALAAVVIAVVILNKPGLGKTAATPPDSKQSGPHAATAPPAEPPKPSAKLVLNWRESERADAEVYIDDSFKEVPKSGPVEYPLEIQSASHKIRITRKGYHTLEFLRLSTSEETLPPYPVKWFRSFDAWEQDFEKAKAKAAGKKYVLVFFDSSDSAPNSEPFMRVIFSQEEFLTAADKDYVLMYVDLPQTPEARAHVDNPDRNEDLAKKFDVKDYPVVMLIGQDGKPIGVLQTLPERGLKGFFDLLKEWRHCGDELQTLRKEIQTATDPAKKNEAICKAWDLLAGNDLERYYEPEVHQWVAMLPANMKEHKHPATNADVARWTEQFVRVFGQGANKAAVMAVIAEFDRWKATRSFPDKDVAAKLHFIAAEILYYCGDFPKAIKKCEEGLAYDPPNEQLRQQLEEMKEGLADMGKGEHPSERGTGYFIAEGGYLLTNHHVIQNNKKLKVRLAGRAEPVPAKLIAQDVEGDIALLKAEIPEGVKITPMPVVPGAKAGQAICVMGFPARGNPRENSGNFAKSPLTITTGIISKVPAPGDKESEIELDCRVNPGNSGGPLFNDRGAIVGMIRAKSLSLADRDSIGLAIPGEKLVAFLKQHLPASAALASKKPAAKPIEWPQLKEQMEPSIVCVLNYQ
jgi:S1-C subfamily serine protease/thioredoxin-related protein/DNA-directed RNA polymerase subunit RPC12/RpoP